MFNVVNMSRVGDTSIIVDSVGCRNRRFGDRKANTRNDLIPETDTTFSLL
jgi:hypothetical protein